MVEFVEQASLIHANLSHLFFSFNLHYFVSIKMNDVRFPLTIYLVIKGNFPFMGSIILLSNNIDHPLTITGLIS